MGADRPGWLELPPSLSMLPFEADALFDMACLRMLDEGNIGRRVPGDERRERGVEVLRV